MCSRLQVTLARSLGAAALAGLVAAQEPEPDAPPTPAELAALAFPECTMQREEVVLSAEQRKRVAEAAEVRAAPVSVVRYTATQEGKSVGAAYVDTRRVRTHGQSLLICVDAAGKVARIEVLAFAEPRQYSPRPEFFASFVGLQLDDQLRLRRKIRPIAGATMSAVASVDSVRTVLAVHAELGARK